MTIMSEHKRDVGPACDREAMHLGNDGSIRSPQRHEKLGVAHHEGVVLHRVPGHLLRHGIAVTTGRLRVIGQVVSGAKGAPGARQHDHMHALVGIGPLHRVRQFARQVVVDGVEHVRPVERDARDAPVLLVQHLGHDPSQSSVCVNVNRVSPFRRFSSSRCVLVSLSAFEEDGNG
jgi:hypothetical protein